MHQSNRNEGNELYYMYFCRKLSPNDKAPEYGLLIDEKERNRVIDVLEKEYGGNRVIHVSVATGHLQFLIDGVDVTISRDSKEQRDYRVMAFSSEEILPLVGLLERLELKFDEKILMCGNRNLFEFIYG